MAKLKVCTYVLTAVMLVGGNIFGMDAGNVDGCGSRGLSTHSCDIPASPKKPMKDGAVWQVVSGMRNDMCEGFRTLGRIPSEAPLMRQYVKACIASSAVMFYPPVGFLLLAAHCAANLDRKVTIYRSPQPVQLGQQSGEALGRTGTAGELAEGLYWNQSQDWADTKTQDRVDSDSKQRHSGRIGSAHRAEGETDGDYTKVEARVFMESESWVPTIAAAITVAGGAQLIKMLLSGKEKAVDEDEEEGADGEPYSEEKHPVENEQL